MTTEQISLSNVHLESGSHRTRAHGVCLMEAVAWFANEPHSDAPQCACPVLTRYGMRVNDRLRDDERQLLKPLIPLLIGTRSTREVMVKRAYLLADRSIRVILPLCLERRWPEMAAELRSLPEVRDRDSAEKAREVCGRARYAASADAAYAAYAAADASADAAADAYRRRIVAEMIRSLELACEVTS